MCHIDPDQRIRLEELFDSGFFSKDVAKCLKANQIQRVSKIFIPHKSTVSKVLEFKKANPQSRKI